MSEPLAFFLPWTTFGTGLPGDERGWVDDRLRQPATGLRRSAEVKLSQPPVILTETQQSVVEPTVREVWGTMDGGYGRSIVEAIMSTSS